MEWIDRTTFFLSGVGGAIMTGIFKDEIIAWLPRIAAKTIDLAAKRMPSEQQEQCREEWSAHIAEYPGNIAPLYQAGCILIGSGKSKVWTTGRVFRYFAVSLFVFQMYNAYIFLDRVTGRIGTGYFGAGHYLEMYLEIFNAFVLAICLRFNLRDLKSAISRKPESVYGDEVTVREAVMVARWTIAGMITRKFRR